MKELIYLRCYKCNYSFTKSMLHSDKITDITCPNCKKESVEIDLAKPHERLDERVNYHA